MKKQSKPENDHGRGPKGRADTVVIPSRQAAARRALIILGMHRSGTSALTRVANLLGADLPKNLMPPNTENESGFWESDDLMTIHDEALASAGSRWDDWQAIDSGWFNSAAAKKSAARILQVLHQDFEKSRLFVIKDPRLCRLWPLWREPLVRFGAQPLIVLTIRNPLEVFGSLKARNELTPLKAGLLWLRHVIDAERETRDLPRAVVTYDDLLDNWTEVAQEIGRRLHVNWPRRPRLHEIERFLSSSLRHHTYDSHALAESRALSIWIERTYKALLRMVRNPSDKKSRAQLDAVGAEFERSSALFGAMLWEQDRVIAAAEDAARQIRHECNILREQLAGRPSHRPTEAATAATQAVSSAQPDCPTQQDDDVATPEAQVGNARLDSQSLDELRNTVASLSEANCLLRTQVELRAKQWEEALAGIRDELDKAHAQHLSGEHSRKAEAARALTAETQVRLLLDENEELRRLILKLRALSERETATAMLAAVELQEQFDRELGRRAAAQRRFEETTSRPACQDK
jgi:hypothetical protein